MRYYHDKKPISDFLMKAISNINQAFLRTLFLFISLPAVTWAGVKMDNVVTIDQNLTIKIASIFIAALVGGISSSFVKTSFDENSKHPIIFKIFVGLFLGGFSGLMALEHLGLGIFTLLLPTFVIASLGAPIMVFYLLWLSDAETQAEIKDKIKQKVSEKFGAK